MKNLVLVFTFLFFGCQAEIKPQNQEQLDEDKVEVNQVDVEDQNVEVDQVEPEINKGICSYKNDSNKGCLKASIGSSMITIGNFSYDRGVSQIAKEFPTDLQNDSSYLSLNSYQVLEFSRRLTEYNFYNDFSIIVEGSHTTYSSYHTGLGNLQVDGMYAGYYNILVTKQIDLKVFQDDKLIGYKCAIIWTSRTINISPGQETALMEPISEFELDVYDNGCQGQKVKSLIIPEQDQLVDKGSKKD